MTSFFRNYSPGTLWRSLALLAAFVGTLWVQMLQPAVAQTIVTGPSTAQTVSTPAPSNFAPALSFQAWQNFTGIAVADVKGGDGKGVKQVVGQGLATMTIDGNLAANTNPNCGVACNLTQSTMKLNAVISTGAMASNQGTGTGPISAQIGGNALGQGAMVLRTIYVQPTTAP